MSFEQMQAIIDTRTNYNEQRAIAITLANDTEYYNTESMGQFFDRLANEYGETHVKVLPNGCILAGTSGTGFRIINPKLDPNVPTFSYGCGQNSIGLYDYIDIVCQYVGDDMPPSNAVFSGNEKSFTECLLRAERTIGPSRTNEYVVVGFSYSSATVFNSAEKLLENGADVKYIVSLDPVGTNLIKDYHLDLVNKNKIPVLMFLQEKAQATGHDYVNNFGEIAGQFLKSNPDYDFRSFVIAVPEKTVEHGVIPRTIIRNGFLQATLGLSDEEAVDYNVNYYRVKCDENGKMLWDANNQPVLERIKNIDSAVALNHFLNSKGSLITSCEAYVNDRMSSINTYAQNMLNSMSSTVAAIGKIGINSNLLGEIQSCLGGYCSSFSVLADKISKQVTAINSYAKGYEDMDIDLSALAASLRVDPTNDKISASALSSNIGGSGGNAGGTSPANKEISLDTTPKKKKDTDKKTTSDDNATKNKKTSSNKKNDNSAKLLDSKKRKKKSSNDDNYHNNNDVSKKLTTKEFKGIANRSYIVSYDENNKVQEFKEVYKFSSLKMANEGLADIKKEYTNLDVKISINSENNVEVIYDSSMIQGKTLDQVTKEFMKS